jgi:hypothetical protein
MYKEKYKYEGVVHAYNLSYMQDLFGWLAHRQYHNNIHFIYHYLYADPVERVLVFKFVDENVKTEFMLTWS